MDVQFKPPVWIRDGTLMLRAIVSAAEARAFLRAFTGMRGAVFHTTLSMMNKAVHGEILADEARLAFCRFAEDVGLLAESTAA